MGDRVAMLPVIRTRTPAFRLNPAGSSSVPLRNCQRRAPRMTLRTFGAEALLTRSIERLQWEGFARTRFFCGLSSNKSCGSAHLGGGSRNRSAHWPIAATANAQALRQTSLQRFRCRLERPTYLDHLQTSDASVASRLLCFPDDDQRFYQGTPVFDLSLMDPFPRQVWGAYRIGRRVCQ